MNNSNPQQPPTRTVISKRLGILGGGQLGMMIAQAGKRAGIETHVYAPPGDNPAAKHCFRFHAGQYDDWTALERFCATVDLVTLEFENIPMETAQYIETRVPLCPSAKVLATCQDRAAEKTFLRDNAIPTTPFRIIGQFSDYNPNTISLTPPLIFKSSRSGYDGKGQIKVDSIPSSETFKVIWGRLGGQSLIIEQFVDFACEASVIIARSRSGQLATIGPIQNNHRRHILDISEFPSQLVSATSKAAIQTTISIAKNLNLFGLLCVEFFVTKEGQAWVNELAPRPHNSGHLTLEGFTVSQFDLLIDALFANHLRKSEPKAQAIVMANILGDHWPESQSPIANGRTLPPECFLHWYGKSSSRPGRKLGHITALGNTIEDVKQLVTEFRDSLNRERTSDRHITQ